MIMPGKHMYLAQIKQNCRCTDVQVILFSRIFNVQIFLDVSETSVAVIDHSKC